MAAFPGPPPPPHHSNTTRTVLVVVGVVLVLCCAGGVVTGVFIYRGVRGAVSSVAAARAAVDAFLGDLEQGRTDAAYDELCAPVQQAMTREAFARTPTVQQKPSRHQIDRTRVSNVDGRVSADVHAQLWYADGTTGTRGYILAREDGWKVCNDPPY